MSEALPVRIKIEADETKGQYADYDTFLGPEAAEYLRLYLNDRKRGSPDDGHGQKIPPEELYDRSPLIRDSQSRLPKHLGEKQVYKLVHSLYHRAGLLKKNKNGGYELRVHSIRKFFKTQLMALGVGEAYVDYMMGHKGSTYHDIQMKGIEFLRKLYADARLSIRPQPRSNKVDLLKQMARTVGASPEEIAEALASMAEPHRIHATPQERENDEIQALTKVFVDKIRTGSKAAP